MRLRVAIWSNFYKPIVSGVVTSIALFRKGLIEHGHDVHIFTTEAENFEDDEPYVYRLPALIDLTESYEFALALPIKGLMKQTMKGIKPHLIHSQHPVLVGDLAARYAQELGLPLVFTFHTHYEALVKQNLPFISDLAGQVARDVLQDYLTQCAHIIAPTPSIRQMICDEYGIDAPVSVLPTPIDLADYACLDPESIRDQYQLKGKQVLLFLGRIAQEKNLDMLLDAFSIITTHRPNVVLMIVGRGPHSEALQRLAQDLGIDDHIIFTGVVPHEQVPHYMAAADLFVFPSSIETQGLVLVEALAAGTPVVAVDVIGSADVLTGNNAGLLVQNDEAAFAEAVLSLLNNPDRLAQMQEMALQLAQSYSIGSATDHLIEIYEQAIASGPRPVKRSVFSRP